MVGTQVGAQRVGGDVVVPFCPLPEGEGIAGAMVPTSCRATYLCG